MKIFKNNLDFLLNSPKLLLMNKRTIPRKREYLPELPVGSKRIPGFEAYFISPEGLILSPATKGYLIRRAFLGKDGYARIVLSLGNQKLTTKYVHRLVAEAFIPCPNPEYTVNHKNLDKSDNRATNLEWISFQDNQRHWRKNNPEAAKKGSQLTGAKVSRPITAINPSNGTTYTFPSLKAAASWTNGYPANISHAASRKKKAYGFLWKYASRRKRHNPSRQLANE